MHFGGICHSSPSHVMCTGAIGRELEKRGHRFTLFSPPHMKPWNEREGLSSFFLAHSDELARRLDDVRAQKREPSISDTIQGLIRDANYLHQELPPAIKKAGVDCLVIDAYLLGASSAAQALGLPFVNFFCALPQHEEPAIPPMFLPWPYNGSLWGRLRNQTAFTIRNFLVRPLMKELNAFRHQHGLAPYRSLGDDFSSLAQVTQLVADFDFPRTRLPACFHYAGPYFRHAQEAAMPFDPDQGRPLVYAALGTILGSNTRIWTSIAEACAPLPVQLVIALGTNDSSSPLPDLPGEPVVLGYAPQEAILMKAAVFITHAGMNSTLEGLAHGVPMLAMPFLIDQPGVAQRIAYHGLGKVMGKERYRPYAVRQAISELLTNRAFRDRCKAMSRSFQSGRGAAKAAAIFERAALTKQPVLRDACESW